MKRIAKVLSVILAVTCAVSMVMLSASADDYGGINGVLQNDAEYFIAVTEIVQKAHSGELSPTEAFREYKNLSTDLVSDNFKELLPYSSETELEGVTSRDFVNHSSNSLRSKLRERGVVTNEFTETVQNFDMKGYGSAVKYYNYKNTSERFLTFYGSYIIINTSDSFAEARIFADDGRKLLIVQSWDGQTYNGDRNQVFYPDDYPYCFFYGDVRYTDGTQAEDFKTPITAIENTYNVDGLSDAELANLLQDMINQMKSKFPDMSSIDGMLRALLSMCQSMNDKLCSASDVRGMIDDIISALKGNGESCDHSAVISALENLKYENNNEQFIADLETLIGLNGNYDEVSKIETVKSHLRLKTGFITDIRHICDTAVSAYMNTKDSVDFDINFNGNIYNMNFDVFASHMPLIRLILAVFVYLSFAWRTYRKIPDYINGGGDDK